MTIVEVPLSEVWLLRQQVMYPDQDIKAVQLDNDSEGIHVGVYKERVLVSVISLFGGDKRLQFRKFATHEAFQRQGIGAALLEHVITWARSRGYETIWCNARLTASSFYSRFGLEPVGEPWTKNAIDYIKMQKDL